MPSSERSGGADGAAPSGGHERLVAPGTGAKAKLTPAEGILATVFHLRKLATMDLLGQLYLNRPPPHTG